MNNGKLDNHRREQLVENVRFMEQAGEHPSRIAARLGMTTEAVSKMLERTNG